MAERNEARVVYVGPIDGALAAATALADAIGVDLVGQRRLPAAGGDADGVARLELTLSGTDADVQAAIVAVSRDLPGGASLAVA